MALDDSFGLPPVWVTEDYFTSLNNLSRNDILATVAFHDGTIDRPYDLDEIAAFSFERKVQLKLAMGQRRMCHHCQKLVPEEDIVVCHKQNRKLSNKKSIRRQRIPDREHLSGHLQLYHSPRFAATAGAC